MLNLLQILQLKMNAVLSRNKIYFVLTFQIPCIPVCPSHAPEFLLGRTGTVKSWLARSSRFPRGIPAESTIPRTKREESANIARGFRVGNYEVSN